LCQKAEPTLAQNGANGGFADYIRVEDAWVFPIPEVIPPEKAASLLCAGVTVYAPLKRYIGLDGIGKKVGILGLGGLGHLFVQMASKIGCEVYVFSHKEEKRDDALRKLGATQFINVSDKAGLKALNEKLDFVVSTYYGDDINWMDFVDVVTANGTICFLGWNKLPIPVTPFGLIYRQRKVVGSNVGNLVDTQEVLEFCATKGIQPVTELYSIHEVQKVREKFDAEGYKYRAILRVYGEFEEEASATSA